MNQVTPKTLLRSIRSLASAVIGLAATATTAFAQLPPTLVSCEVTVDAFCRILLPPVPPSGDDCDGKVVRLGMVYTGDDCGTLVHNQDSSKVSCSGVSGPLPDNVYIRSTNGSDPNDGGAKIWFEGAVTKLGTYDILAFSGGEDDLDSNTYVHIFDAPGGNLLQSVQFHTSCSQPLAVGNQFGANLVFEMESANGGIVTLPQTDPDSDCSDCEEECELPASVGPGCDGKVVELQVIYTGEDCGSSINSQSADKAKCQEFLPAGVLLSDYPTVFIRATDEEDPNDLGGKKWFEGEVDLNEVFTLKASNAGEDDLSSATHIHIFDLGGNLLQSIEFHTSCSQPLNVGDQFGSLFVVGLDTSDSPLQTFPEVEFTYVVSNTGSLDLNDLTVIDSFGPVGGVDPVLKAGETVEIKVVVTAYDSLTNKVTVSANGGDCAAEDTVIITKADPPQDCCEDGKPRVLTMEFTGAGSDPTSHAQDPDKVSVIGDNTSLPASVYIVANDDDSPGSGDIWFAGEVALNSTFDINATLAGEDHFSSETRIHIFAVDGSGNPIGNRLQYINFHTSCSQPLFTGNQFGAVKLNSCISENEPIPGDCCADGKPRVLTMEFTGAGSEPTSHAQDPDKVSVIGDNTSLPASVYIVANDDDSPGSGDIWFAGEVALNTTFDINATLAGEDHFSSETRIHIFAVDGSGNPIGNRLQYINFHTSCSQPLFAGNQFGAVKLESCVSENEPIPGDCCDDGKPRLLTMQFTGADSGPTSHAQDPNKVAVAGDNASLPANVYIVANDNDSPGSGKIWFAGEVALNSTFDINATLAGEDHFSSETRIHIFAVDGSGNPIGNRLQYINFHTSCSQPLFVGNQFGAVKLESCVSENTPIVPGQ